MYLITDEVEAINLELFADAAGMEEEVAKRAPVVALYSNTLPAPAAAVNPFIAELVQANDAIAATISELNMLVLNTADAALRNQVKQIATVLVNKAPLMEATKENYLQMLDAAEANAAFYYGKPVVDAPHIAMAPVAAISRYKRKYETATEIAKHLGTASSLKEVAALYYVNAELIEQTQQLKTDFINKKARLYRPSSAAA